MILDETIIKKLLRTKWLGQKLFMFDSLGSTNDYLRDMAEKDDVDGTVVIADLQNAGRGRFGRRWFSPKGGGIWMSILIEGVDFNNSNPALSLSVAVGISDAIKSMYGVDLAIRWPNDIVYNRRKLVGVLLESGSSDSGSEFVICGLGINTDFSNVSVPKDLKDNIISLSEIVGKYIDRNILISEILNNLEFIIDRFRDGSINLKSLLFGKECYIGSDVIWSDSGKFIEGEITGFREDGALIVNSCGVEHYLLSGSITIL